MQNGGAATWGRPYEIDVHCVGAHHDAPAVFLVRAGRSGIGPYGWERGPVRASGPTGGSAVLVY